MIYALIAIEGLVMCFVLLITCVVAIANGPIGGVALYEADVQKRVVELGYTTEKKIKKTLICMFFAMYIPLFTLTPLMVYFINGARDFWDLFWQMTVVLWIMGLFDRLFIDWYWVGRTKAWYIPKTDDLMPYIPKKALFIKWGFTLFGLPAIAAIISFVIDLLN